MSGKRIERYLLNRERFLEVLDFQGLSIRSLGRDKSFRWNEKSIRRALKDGASLSLLLDLSNYLNVDVNTFVEDSNLGYEIILDNIPIEEFNTVRTALTRLANDHGLTVKVNVKPKTI